MSKSINNPAANEVANHIRSVLGMEYGVGLLPVDIRPALVDGQPTEDTWAIKVFGVIPYVIANQVVSQAVRQDDNMTYIQGGRYHIFVLPAEDASWDEDARAVRLLCQDGLCSKAAEKGEDVCVPVAPPADEQSDWGMGGATPSENAAMDAELDKLLDEESGWGVHKSSPSTEPSTEPSTKEAPEPVDPYLNRFDLDF